MNSEEETRVFEVDKVREIYGPNVIVEMIFFYPVEWLPIDILLQ